MRFEPPLVPATLVRRYKRFLADVVMADGSALTVHTPNTGSMTGCAEAGSRVWLRDSGDPKRKYRYSWEITENSAGVLVGVNTGLTNRLVMEGIRDGIIEELGGYEQIRPEVAYGSEGSRIDLLLSGSEGSCHVEIKNVTTCDADGFGWFPDAVTARGTKHLRELMGVAAAGGRAVIFYCVQRGDAQRVRPADEVDPLYGRTLRQAIAAGVEALAYQAEVTPLGIRLVSRLPVVCPAP